jgi:hypothetical protein
MSGMRFAVVWIGLFIIVCGCAAEDSPAASESRLIYAEMPGEIDPSDRYLFYLHGRIIEEKGVRPTHPRFGVYEYEKILEAFADRGFVVISEVRPSGADVASWAGRVANQVRRLIDGGVPPDHVTVVGFSKGGVIAIFASSELANDQLNFVFMGACGPWIKGQPDLVPRGRLLALRDSTDDLVGPCAPLFARGGDGGIQREVVTDLGGGHGAYYRPHSAWVDEVTAWGLAGG